MTILPIQIPPGVQMLVKKDDAVIKGQVIAKTPENSTPGHEISLTKLLGVSVRDAGKYLVKQPGDQVSVGDIIARKSGFLSHMEVRSQVEGVVTRYDRGNGVVEIKKPEEVNGKIYEITAPIDGSIEDITQDQVLVKTEKDVLMGEKGSGKSVQAQVIILEEKDGGDGFYSVDVQAIDKIIMLAHVSKDTVMKASGIGVKGIVTKDITAADFSYVEERENDFPLVLVSENVYDDLCKGKNTSLFLSGKEKILIPA